MEVATVENNNESKDHSNNNNNNNNNRTLFSFYSNYIWNRVLAFLPSSSSSSSSASNVFAKISNLYRQSARVGSRIHGACLPLPLPSNSFDSASLVMSDTSRVYEVLEDILEHIFLNLRNVQKNLQFWQSRAEGSNARKMYFMIFERGPLAFIDGAVQLIRGCADEGSSMQHLCHSASSHISERVAVLSSLRCALATFLAQIYMEVDRFGEKLVKDPENSLPLLLVTINDIFSNLEASIGHLHAMRQSVYSVEGSYSLPLLFEKLSGVNQEGSQWTDCEVRDAINLIYQNLLKLDSYLSDIVAKHRKPRKITLHWIRYTCGAVGLSVCSIWVLRHSSLMGNSDIDKWIGDARDSTVSFFNDHVEQPLLSIRDELFETFRKRHKGVMEPEEVLLTSNSLHRMLLAFSEQTKGQKIPENASDQELLEIVMSRYEKELMHPVQNLLSGELARALLIQVQKLKLDIETAMLELDQILKANEINFAILAALPAFFLSLILLMLVRTWFKRDTRAEGRGRMARVQRRLLIVEVEKRIVQYQTYVDQGQEKDAQCMFGLVLYSLDRLYHAVEKHAKATGEWQCLRQDIIDLGKPDLKTTYKLLVTSRLERLYDCLLPSPTRR
ncbi:protein DGS1, mitochondrial [Quercus robur]|uniref:protein DGS1, mitochondrial n=1 Tax=Quercus robur TaxID=38942 RepID=UPI0021617B3D|nr:protein DGS1, mitochondrial [Quercus robur]